MNYKSAAILLFVFTLSNYFIFAVEQAVEIPIDPPLRAQTRFSFAGELDFREQVVAKTPQGVRPVKVLNAALSLNAEVTVVSVNAGGKPTELRVEVTRGLWRESDRPSVAIESGAIIRVWRDREKQRLSVNAVEQKSTLSELLGKIFSVQNDTDLKPGAFMSPSRPVSPGAVWPVRGDILVSDLAKYGIEGVLPKQVKGDVKFDSIGKLGGQQSAKMTVNCELDSSTAQQPGENLVGITRFRSMRRGSEERSLSPAFPASRSASEEVTGTEMINLKDREAPALQIQTRTIQTVEFIPTP